MAKHHSDNWVTCQRLPASAGQVLHPSVLPDGRILLCQDWLLHTKSTTLPDDSNRMALTMDVEDMEALDAMMKSEAGAEAMKYDGVRPETVVVYVEG